MALGSKAYKFCILTAGVALAALTWPSYVDGFFPGWSARTSDLRAKLPWTTKIETQTAARGGPANAEEARRRAIAARPAVPVDTDIVQRGPMPLRVDAVGTVQPIATIAIKSRIDAQIEKIFVADGAQVKEGELLVQLDARQINAQIRQTEATIAKDQSVVDGAQRDMSRLSELLARGSGTQLAVENAKTALAAAKATIASDQALLENQRVQLSWYTLKAPITGRVSTFTAKAGNIIRSGDNTATGSLATIVQTSPIYVAFSVPQAVLAEIREAIARGEGIVTATPQGGTRFATGKISVLDNMIDATTGTITLRALFDNADDVLWPGQLCNIRVTLRTDPSIVSIPRSATQSGQIGNFVYIVDGGVAKMRPVKVGRFQDGRDLITDGLSGGETIVSDGGLLLIDGIRVDIKNKSKSAAPDARGEDKAPEKKAMETSNSAGKDRT